jgi:GNAT superfamily N-acetyltransferase
VKRVFVARYTGPGLGGSDARQGMIAAVAVESLPALGCALRNIAFGGRFSCVDRRLSAAKLNREMRTISRVVVHPMFRSTGLAVALVRHVLRHAQTPCVEALAAMGRVHPFFERAGMKAFDRPPRPEAVRLLAAMEQQKLCAMDLMDSSGVTQTPFLLGELRRFSRQANPTFEELVAEARARLLCQPVYFAWIRADGVAGNRSLTKGSQDGDANPAS